MSLLFFVILCYDNFCTKSDTSDTIKYIKIPKNTETQQRNTKENTKNKLCLIKKDFLINTSENM